MSCSTNNRKKINKITEFLNNRIKFHVFQYFVCVFFSAIFYKNKKTPNNEIEVREKKTHTELNAKKTRINRCREHCEKGNTQYLIFSNNKQNR